MNFARKNPPRRFTVGTSVRFEMHDCGSLQLEPDEQITLTTPHGGEYDVARKSWGFYATPSLNGRLPQYGLRPALVKNQSTSRQFVLLVERGAEPSFASYCAQETLAVIAWLDDESSLSLIEAALAKGLAA